MSEKPDIFQIVKESTDRVMKAAMESADEVGIVDLGLGGCTTECEALAIRYLELWLEMWGRTANAVSQEISRAKGEDK